MTGFPISLATPVAHAGPLPKAADVVVIGGGIIGVMSAWYLAKRGLSVALLEKGRIAGEQSSRNWGWVRQQGRDPAELPIMVEALRIWHGLADEVGADLGLRQTGVTYLAKDAAEIGRFERWLPYACENDVDSRLLSGREVRDLLPEAARNWPGALCTGSDCRAEPWLAVPAIAHAAARAGVAVLENCAARQLDIAAGQVAGVITEKGRIAATNVVLAGGAWSALFARAHGISLPQLSVRATVAATEPLAEVFAGCAADHQLAFRRRVDGGYTLAPSEFHELFIGPDAFRNLRSFLPQLKQNPFGTRFYPAAPRGYPDARRTPRRWGADEPSPFEAMRILNPAPNLKKVAQIAGDFADTFPTLGPVKIKSAWSGMIDTMPDVVPVIDRAAAIPGLTIATGMSGHGFGIGPAIGRIVSDLVTGHAVGHDLSRFRLSRFSDGTKLDLGPSL